MLCRSLSLDSEALRYFFLDLFSIFFQIFKFAISKVSVDKICLNLTVNNTSLTEYLIAKGSFSSFESFCKGRTQISNTNSHRNLEDLLKDSFFHGKMSFRKEIPKDTLLRIYKEVIWKY